MVEAGIPRGRGKTQKLNEIVQEDTEVEKLRSGHSFGDMGYDPESMLVRKKESEKGKKEG